VSEDFSVYPDARTLSAEHSTLEIYSGAIQKMLRRPVKSPTSPKILNYFSNSKNCKKNRDKGWFMLYSGMCGLLDVRHSFGGTFCVLIGTEEIE
jgi:hypothetical protein